MSDLEQLAYEAWLKWTGYPDNDAAREHYQTSPAHLREAWQRTLQPAAARIEELDMGARNDALTKEQQHKRIAELERLCKFPPSDYDRAYAEGFTEALRLAAGLAVESRFGDEGPELIDWPSAIWRSERLCQLIADAILALQPPQAKP